MVKLNKCLPNSLKLTFKDETSSNSAESDDDDDDDDEPSPTLEELEEQPSLQPTPAVTDVVPAPAMEPEVIRINSEPEPELPTSSKARGRPKKNTVRLAEEAATTTRVLRSKNKK